ncbi:MAG: ferrochelatase [Ignavibacteriaceae bacterium]|nr:ferrochelatase [Ignavibacteriaceae bacterium]
MKSKTGVLLVNLGTPDSPSVPDVRKYLFEFLNDPRVIDLPWLLRKFLVNVIIVPFRAPKSAKIYQQLWTKEGSPLLIYGLKVKEKLQNALGDNFDVELAMRYQNPSMNDVLEKMRKNQHEKLIIIPLFPQYASATTGSVIEKVMKIISKWWVIPEVKFIGQFYDNEDFINSFVQIAKKYEVNEYDHVLFSYHGLPVRQLDKVYVDGKKCTDHDCENEVNEDNKFCYKAACYATSRLLAEKLNIPKDKYTVCFQSRLAKDWQEPFTDKVIIKKANGNAKKLLVFSPAFVSDCLETTVEIGIEYQKLFHEHGGEKIQLVESLNEHPLWIETLKNMVLKESV